jgi:hypothetical protein
MGKNHGHSTANQVRRQRGQSIELTVRPAIFNRHVAAFNIAGFAQALAQSDDLRCEPLG